jgi:hypothetical protein
MSLSILIKRKTISAYILLVEGIANVVYKIGDNYGLSMTSAKFWRILNNIWGHCFTMRAKHKIFTDETN